MNQLNRTVVVQGDSRALTHRVVQVVDSFETVVQSVADAQAASAQATQASNDAVLASQEAVQAAEEAVLAAANAQVELDSRAYAVASYHPITAPAKIRVAGYGVAGDGGGGLYTRVTGEPPHGGKFSVTDSVGGVWWYELAEPEVNPEMFGALISTVNNAPAVGLMLTYAAQKGAAITGRNRTYRTAATTSLPIYRHRMRDITIDGRDIATNGLFTTPVVEMICPEPSAIGNLTADIGSNGTAVTLSAVAGLAVNDWVLLRSKKIMAETEVEADATRHSRACELLRVRSISGMTVTFWSRTKDGYTVADTATLAKVRTAGGVDWSNVEVIGADTGLLILDGFESRYRDCRFVNQTSRCIFEDRCYRTNGDNWQFSSLSTEPTFTAAPYGLCFTACQDCNYGNVRGHRMRHVTTTGSNSAGRGRSVSQGCTLGDVTGTDCFSSVVDQHPGGGFLQVGNVYATFAQNASQFVACQFQGAGGSVKSIEANNGMGVMFDTYGFFQNNFTPFVSVGFLHSRNSDFSVSLSNHSNRYGTGTSQTIRCQIECIDAYSGVGASLNPGSGGIDFGISSGHITALTSLGLGRVIYATVGGAGGTANVRIGNVNMRAQSGSRIIQMDGGKIQISGGALAGVGGTTELRLTDAVMTLIGTDETALTEGLTTSTIRRAALS